MKGPLHLLHVVVAIALFSVVLDANWPSFRGPSSSGVATGAPPITWDVSTGTNVAWRTQVPGMGHSSPIVWGDRVYVTTAVPLNNEAAAVTLGDSSKAGIDSATDTGAHEWRLPNACYPATLPSDPAATGSCSTQLFRFTSTNSAEGLFVTFTVTPNVGPAITFTDIEVDTPPRKCDATDNCPKC